ncbi:phosphodiester glycosidase family protein [Actinomadura sp. 21ATH]|uniref:phosphodiester glycosidase family protein n=1 Tax=Actinomadura sp. 21ATH TaxID=1735444 RepID=UPI0035BEE028
MLAPTLIALLAVTATAVPAPADSGAGPLETDRRTRRVGPGTTLTSFERLSPGGWLRADLLTVDLTGRVRAGYLSPGTVSAVEPLSRQAGRAGAIAAVNGDFFDIGRTGAPEGPAVAGGGLVKSAAPGRSTATAGIGAGGLGQIARIVLDGEVLLPGGRRVRLDRLNAHRVDGIGAYTPLWGARPRAAGTTEVLVVNGRVAAVTSGRRPGSGPVPADGFVLVENGGAALRSLKPGDPVGLRHRPRSSGRAPLLAVGGRQILVEDGRIPALPDPARHPRTAAGFTAGGRRMLLMTVDGRQAASRGATLAELARLMREAGADDALNLDGGGSSTLLARAPGRARPRLENRPSGGAERRVPNGIGLFAEGSGRLRGFTIEAASARVFPGLTRRLAAHGHDEALGPARGTPRWLASRGRVGRNGTYRATGRSGPGPVEITARRGAARGRYRLTVLGRLDRIAAVRQGPDTFGIVGYDREGHTAPIAPSDARLSYDASKVTVERGATAITVTPRGPAASAAVTVDVAGERTALPAGTAPVPPVADPLVVQDGALAPGRRRFAMVSGPSPRALREIAAARPDLLLVNGLGGGLAADPAAAKRALDALGVPYRVVAGEREGTAAFRAAFGRPWRTFDRGGTRFVLLDSSAGTYRAGAFRQFRMVRRALAGARRDPSVHSVIVAGHGTADAREAALLRHWLSAFRTATGKGAAMLDARGPAFRASRLDGVRAFTGGGADAGWTLFGTSPARAPGWLRAEVRPRVDALALAAPAAMPAGTTARVSAVITQGGRAVPLAYPMTADWSTTGNLRLDPATGRLRALRPGPAAVTVTVNGVRRKAALAVTPLPAA